MHEEVNDDTTGEAEEMNLEVGPKDLAFHPFVVDK